MLGLLIRSEKYFAQYFVRFHKGDRGLDFGF